MNLATEEQMAFFKLCSLAAFVLLAGSLVASSVGAVFSVASFIKASAVAMVSLIIFLLGVILLCLTANFMLKNWENIYIKKEEVNNAKHTQDI